MTDYFATLPTLKTRHLPLSFSAIFNYMSGRMTPARLLNDLAIADLFPYFAGKIIEIGATKSGNHKKYSNHQNEYILSNISEEDGYLYWVFRRICG